LNEAVLKWIEIKEIKLAAADHPNWLASQHELARVYEANGSVTEAITLLEHVVEIEKTKLAAADHPRRVVSEDLLSYYYKKYNSKS
jgi:hypothetical protein